MTRINRRQALHAGLGVAAATAVGVNTACSSGGSSSKSSADAPSGELTIMVSSASASDQAFKQVNEAFMKKHPDVDVKFTAVPNDSYPASLSSRLSAKKVDIFVAQSMSTPPAYAKDSEEDSVRLARAGGMLDLSDKDFVKNFEPSVLDSIRLDDKLFVLPAGISYTTGLYYNKKIFKDAGISDPPTTWGELQEVFSTLKDKDVVPLGIGGKEGWPAGLHMLAAVEGLYPAAEDKEKLAEQLWKNEIKLTDDGPLEVLKRVQTIYENGQSNFAGAGYDEIPGAFGAGKYAMIADGTWNQPIIDKAVDGAFEYGYVPNPLGDDAKANDHLTGKVELMLSASSATKNEGAVLAWLTFFATPEVYADFIKTAGYSSAQPNSKQSSFLKSIKEYTKEFRTPWSHYWFANNKAGQEAVFPFNYPGVKPLGPGTAEQAAAAAQKAWAGAF